MYYARFAHVVNNALRCGELWLYTPTGGSPQTAAYVMRNRDPQHSGLQFELCKFCVAETGLRGRAVPPPSLLSITTLQIVKLSLSRRPILFRLFIICTKTNVTGLRLLRGRGSLHVIKKVL